MRTFIEPPPASSNALLQLCNRIAARREIVARMRPRLRHPRAYWNWAVANWEWRTKATRITARPLKLTIDPTNACHLRCPLCPTGRRELDRPPGHLSPALFQRLLEETAGTLFFIDFFNWGEPLLNPHTEELIAMAAAKGIVCAMSTNLSLPLTDARIHRLITSGLHEIIVSLDGATAETYTQYRKGGDFDLVCANVRKIVAEKRRLGVTSPLITWQFLVFHHNEHEQQLAREMAQEMGVDRIAFRSPMLDIDSPDLPPPDRDSLLAWAPDDQTFRVKYKRPTACSWHYMSAAINWDGSVAPCCGVHSKQDDFGALTEAPYMDVVNNPVYQSARAASPTGRACDDCPVPGIKDYHRHLNRQIAIQTAATVWNSIFHAQTPGATTGNSHAIFPV
jgi:MoaA/NifB/PqqE/SkfB family radical SAM enzyme